MRYLYAGIGVMAGIIWVSAFVCAIIASIRQEPTAVVCSWLVLAAITLVAGRLAGSLLKAKMAQHDEAKKEKPGTD